MTNAFSMLGEICMVLEVCKLLCHSSFMLTLSQFNVCLCHWFFLRMLFCAQDCYYTIWGLALSSEIQLTKVWGTVSSTFFIFFFYVTFLKLLSLFFFPVNSLCYTVRNTLLYNYLLKVIVNST